MIYLIITTCINNRYGVNNFEERKQRYIDCIQSAVSIVKKTSFDEVGGTHGETNVKPCNITPIIVENNGERETYLNDLGCEVIYTNNNLLSFPQKGINELLDIKHVIDRYNISDDDIIIKLTGRYRLLSNAFLELIINNQHNYDAFVKFYNVCSQQFDKNDCALGLFAIRCKYMRNFEYKCQSSCEIEFAAYVKNNIRSLMEINDLNLECCFADDLRLLVI
jgi:hypothetical protein